jgi:hypothetical protein
MMPQYFHILHVFSVIMLFSICAAAAAAPLPANRKKFLMWSGIASLVVFISGFGLAGILKIGFPVWIWMKIFCWLGLSVLVGVFFRTPQHAKRLMHIAILLAFFAVSMVYLKP